MPPRWQYETSDEREDRIAADRDTDDKTTDDETETKP